MTMEGSGLMSTWIMWTALRLTGALLIFVFPLPGVVISILFDLNDYFFLKLEGSGFQTYQFWDKALDSVFLTTAALSMFFWKNKLAIKIGLSLFLLRSLGVWMFLNGSSEKLLFLFPNFFESYFAFYIFHKRFVGEKLLKRRSIYMPVLLLIFVPKLMQEFTMHFTKVPLPTTYHEIIFFFLLPTMAFYFSVSNDYSSRKSITNSYKFLRKSTCQRSKVSL